MPVTMQKRGLPFPIDFESRFSFLIVESYGGAFCEIQVARNDLRRCQCALHGGVNARDQLREASLDGG